MKLYIGGAFQGQDELAAKENPSSELFLDFHETIRAACDSGESPREFANRFADEHSNAVIVANEVGSGVVPLNASERMYRENTGRALCVIASRAESVIRVVCGIGTRIK